MDMVQHAVLAQEIFMILWLKIEIDEMLVLQFNYLILEYLQSSTHFGSSPFHLGESLSIVHSSASAGKVKGKQTRPTMTMA